MKSFTIVQGCENVTKDKPYVSLRGQEEQKRGSVNQNLVALYLQIYRKNILSFT